MMEFRGVGVGPRFTNASPGPCVTRAPKIAWWTVMPLDGAAGTSKDAPGCTDEVTAGADVVTGADRAGGAEVECDGAGAEPCEPREPPEEWLPPPKPPPPPKWPPPPPPICPPPPPWPPRCANAAEGANSNSAAAKIPTKSCAKVGRYGVERVIFAPRDADRGNGYVSAILHYWTLTRTSRLQTAEPSRNAHMIRFA